MRLLIIVIAVFYLQHRHPALYQKRSLPHCCSILSNQFSNCIQNDVTAQRLSLIKKPNSLLLLLCMYVCSFLKGTGPWPPWIDNKRIPKSNKKDKNSNLKTGRNHYYLFSNISKGSQLTASFTFEHEKRRIIQTGLKVWGD